MPQCKDMKYSPKGYAHTKLFESCKLHAYPDPKTGGAPWTCGWGETGPDITQGTVWTQAYADQRFVESIEQREAVMHRELGDIELTQGQFDALLDILFNVGYGRPRTNTDSGKDGIFMLKNGFASSLIRRVREGNFAAAKIEYMKWVSPGSNVERGLTRRRTAALRLWDDYTPASV